MQLFYRILTLIYNNDRKPFNSKLGFYSVAMESGTALNRVAEDNLITLYRALAEQFPNLCRPASLSLLHQISFPGVYKGITSYVRKIFYRVCCAFVIILVLFIGFAFWGWLLPFKERTAWAPNFNPYKFRFEDYQRRDSLQTNLNYIQVPGLDMEDVDRILVHSGGAKKSYIGQATGDNKYRYCYKPWYEAFREAVASAAGDREAMDCGACLYAGHS